VFRVVCSALILLFCPPKVLDYREIKNSSGGRHKGRCATVSGSGLGATEAWAPSKISNACQLSKAGRKSRFRVLSSGRGSSGAVRVRGEESWHSAWRREGYHQPGALPSLSYTCRLKFFLL
jgi:hypothetical protein